MPSQAQLPEAPAPADSLLESINALEPKIRASADWIEENRQLPDDLVDELRATGLFRASWPRSLGGLEIDPMTQIEALEQLSRFDGSVGWLGSFAAISGLLAAHLEPSARLELFRTPDTVSAGSYGPTGRAERVEGGYLVSGKWGFGSGCRHAEVMSAGCFVTVAGEIQRNGEGAPEYRIVMFPKPRAVIDLDSWQVAGMRGTGSHDYVVDKLFVPERHSFNDLDPPYHDGPLYAYHGLFLFSHLPTPLGLGRAALDYIYALGETKQDVAGSGLLKENGAAHEAVARAEAALRSARAWTFEMIGEIWDTLSRGEPLSATQRSLFRLILTHATRVGREVVLEMHDLAASSAIQRGSPIDRIMRDMLTAAAHRIVQKRMYRPSGKVLFGGTVKNDRYF